METQSTSSLTPSDTSLYNNIPLTVLELFASGPSVPYNCTPNASPGC